MKEKLEKLRVRITAVHPWQGCTGVIVSVMGGTDSEPGMVRVRLEDRAGVPPGHHCYVSGKGLAIIKEEDIGYRAR